MKRRYDDPIKIEEAYNNLSPRSFSVFVRLLSIGKRKMERRTLPKLLCLSRNRTSYALRELRLLDYIKLINNGVGKPSIVVINRQLLIGRNQKFVYR